MTALSSLSLSPKWKAKVAMFLGFFKNGTNESDVPSSSLDENMTRDAQCSPRLAGDTKTYLAIRTWTSPPAYGLESYDNRSGAFTLDTSPACLLPQYFVNLLSKSTNLIIMLAPVPLLFQKNEG